jgi:single-stranded DNA-binding protein
MSAADPEDEISVMEFIKRRKALLEANKPAVKKPIVKTENGKSSKSTSSSSSNGKSKSDDKKKRKHDTESEDESSDESSSEEESSDDDDDDKPIGQLLKKRKQDNASSSSSAKKPSKSADGESSKKSSKVASSAAAKKSTEFYTDTDKGNLVQKLLVRWWYAIEWPKPEDIGNPPPGFEALDGFPGVFISTRVRSIRCFFQFPFSFPSFLFLSILLVRKLI